MHYEKPDRLKIGGHQKDTKEIYNSICEAAKKTSTDEFKSFLNDNQNEFSYSPKAGEYIKIIMERRNEEIDIPQLAKDTGISKSYLYQIISVRNTPPKTVKNNPDRKILLAIAITLKFSLDETQHLLKYSQEPELYPRRTFDAVIIFAIERGFSLVETNILLYEKNCELLMFDK